MFNKEIGVIMRKKTIIKLKNKTKSGEKRGFSLIELLIAIFVIAVGLIGVVSLYNMSMVSQFEAKNEVIAANLAQEAVELVRNIRDYNVLNGSDWKTNLDPGCVSIDYTEALDNHNCIRTAREGVCLNAESRYVQCAAVSKNTDFNRTLDIEDDLLDGNNVNYLEITATVSWGDRTTTATSILYPNN